MPAPLEHGGHLVDQDEWDRRKEAEKQARIQRFANGAFAIEQMNPAPQQAPGPLQAAYEREVGRSTPVGPGAHNLDMDALEAQFAQLNQRFSE